MVVFMILRSSFNFRFYTFLFSGIFLLSQHVVLPTIIIIITPGIGGVGGAKKNVYAAAVYKC